jgi:hypothetical protein
LNDAMKSPGKREVVRHPEHGEMPARRLLDCIFALTAAGRIAHYHVEQVDIDERGDTILYVWTGVPAGEERTRCQIIPPFVTEFDRLD